MHRDVTSVAKKRSNKLKYLKLEERKLKTVKKLLYSFKRSFRLGDKQFRVIYTLSPGINLKLQVSSQSITKQYYFWVFCMFHCLFQSVLFTFE